jgi:hypothetical protein
MMATEATSENFADATNTPETDEVRLAIHYPILPRFC